MKDKLWYFGFSLAVTLAALFGSLYGLGWQAALVMAVLILVEVTFSFENAVINAKVLRVLSPLWQTLFLTVGILIAIFGMRIVFPILIVVITADLPWQEVLNLALHNPESYAEKLDHAHVSIAAFGGAFLLMLFLHFFFDRDKKVHWIERLERPLTRYGSQWLPTVSTVAIIAVIAALPINHNAVDTLKSGLLGVGIYVAVRGIERLFSRLKGRPARDSSGKLIQQTGWAAFATFIYLEILDASFSLDGVIGAFAITNSVVLIAAGLGVGAVWVRSLTVYMVRKGTLEKYLYLEHGAHYTVGILAAAMLLSILVAIPEAAAGLAGMVFVGSAVISSRRHQKRHTLAE